MKMRGTVMYRRCRHCPRRRRGSTTLEFAILLPLLMTIALICVDYGRFLHFHIAVTNAARAGAGFGSMHRPTTATRPIWEAQVRQAVRDELSQNTWYDASQLTVPAPQFTDEGNGFWRASVEARYPFQTLVPWPFLPGYSDPISLRRVVVMRGIR